MNMRPKPPAKVKKDMDIRTECTHCRRPGDNSTLVRCDDCKNCFHFHCLDQSMTSSPKKPGCGWLCNKCSPDETVQNSKLCSRYYNMASAYVDANSDHKTSINNTKFIVESAAFYENARNENLYTDVTLNVDGRKFKCHKIILCGVSSYFRAMFSSGMRESRKKEIEIKDMNADRFASVLSYMYSGKIEITFENACEILQIADMIELMQLKKECLKFLSALISVTTCFNIWNMAEQMCMHELADKAKRFAMRNFKEIVSSATIMELPQQCLIDYLSHPALDAHTEENVAETLLSVLDVNSDSFDESPEKIFSKVVDIPNLEPEFLVRLIYEHPFVQKCPTLREVCEKALKEVFKLPHMRSKELCVHKEPRFHTSVVPGIIIFGGISTSGYERKVSILNYTGMDRVTENTLGNLPLIRCEGDLKPSGCTLKGNAYLSGLNAKSPLKDELWRFDFHSKVWSKLAHMNQQRNGHALVPWHTSTNGYILYILGGYSGNKTPSSTALKSVEKYNLSSNRFQLISDGLCYPVALCATACYNEKIFLCGGISPTFPEGTRELQEFNTTTDSCCLLQCDLPKKVVKMHNCAHVQYYNHLIIITQDNVIVVDLEDLVKQGKNKFLVKENKLIEDQDEAKYFVAGILGRNLIVAGGYEDAFCHSSDIYATSVTDVIDKEKAIVWEKVGSLSRKVKLVASAEVMWHKN